MAEIELKIELKEDDEIKSVLDTENKVIKISTAWLRAANEIVDLATQFMGGTVVPKLLYPLIEIFDSRDKIILSKGDKMDNDTSSGRIQYTQRWHDLSKGWFRELESYRRLEKLAMTSYEKSKRNPDYRRLEPREIFRVITDLKNIINIPQSLPPG